MLSSLLVLSLSQLPVLGEAGESCRTDRDCEASLACVRMVCSPKPVAPRVEPIPSAPSPRVVSAPASEVKESAVEVKDSAEPPETPSQFSGIHFFVGANVGAGPSFVQVHSADYGGAYRFADFSGVTAKLPLELRLGVVFGKFEVALEGAPTSPVTGSTLSWLSSVGLSAGWLFRLHESSDFGIYLPARVRAGAFFQYGRESIGVAGSANLGVGFRFGQVLLEARAAIEVSQLSSRGLWTAVSVPLTGSATFIF